MATYNVGPANCGRGLDLTSASRSPSAWGPARAGEAGQSPGQADAGPWGVRPRPVRQPRPLAGNHCDRGCLGDRSSIGPLVPPAGHQRARRLRDMPSGAARQMRRGGSTARTARPPALDWRQLKQETCVSRSFSRPITSQEELPSHRHLCGAGRRVRKQRQRAAALTIYTRTNPFAPSFYSQAARAAGSQAMTRPCCWSGTALGGADLPAPPSTGQAGVLMQHLQSRTSSRPI